MFAVVSWMMVLQGWVLWQMRLIHLDRITISEYKEALERMRRERDMLQREVDFMQSNQG